jgi:transcription termination factor Rho
VRRRQYTTCRDGFVLANLVRIAHRGRAQEPWAGRQATAGGTGRDRHVGEQPSAEAGAGELASSGATGLGQFNQPIFNRIIDLFCLRQGQRALVVAPAKAGKTMVLQAIAEGISKNYPKSLLLILLVDERPEEVTEMEMCGHGEVVASSFDCPAELHVAVAELTLERARRRVEQGEDVVLVSVDHPPGSGAHRRARHQPHHARLDSSAWRSQPSSAVPARIARRGGSLTIISTA